MNNTLLQLLANPKVADVAGSWNKGVNAGQSQAANKQNMNLLQQQAGIRQNQEKRTATNFDQQQGQEKDADLAKDALLATTVGPGPQRDAILKNMVVKSAGDPESTQIFGDIANTPEGPEREKKLKHIIDFSRQTGLLPKDPSLTAQVRDNRTAEIKNFEFGKDNPEFAAMQKKADANKLTEHELRLSTMLANGQIDASQLPKRGNTYNKIVSAAKELNPDLNIRTATGEYTLSKNPAFRQKAMTAEVLPDIMKHIVDAGKKVDFSNVRSIGSFQKFYKENMNDPELVEYMALRNDGLMEIASVMRGAGMTDKAHEAEVEAMNPTLSPRALDAWSRAQTKALAPRLKIMRGIISGNNRQNQPQDNTQSTNGTGYPDGTEIVNDSTGQTMISQGGQWVRKGGL